MERILIVGSTGMLGSEIYNYLSAQYSQVYGLSRGPAPHLKHIKGDITDPELIGYLEDNIDPDIIIHCAAYVDLSFCEQNQIEANNLHVESARALAKLRGKLIYISTDSVFDGIKGNYSESDTPNPLNQYAASKLKGEQAALENDNSLVLRMNIYSSSSPSENSLAEWGIASLKKGEKIRGFTDVLFNPLHVKQAAQLINYFIQNPRLKGIWHLGCSEQLSKYKFLVELSKHFGIRQDLIRPEVSAKLNLTPARPKNTSLNCDKFKNASKIEVHLAEGINFL